MRLRPREARRLADVAGRLTGRETYPAEDAEALIVEALEATADRLERLEAADRLTGRPRAIVRPSATNWEAGAMGRSAARPASAERLRTPQNDEKGPAGMAGP